MSRYEEASALLQAADAVRATEAKLSTLRAELVRALGSDGAALAEENARLRKLEAQAAAVRAQAQAIREARAALVDCLRALNTPPASVNVHRPPPTTATERRFSLLEID